MFYVRCSCGHIMTIVNPSQVGQNASCSNCRRFFIVPNGQAGTTVMLPYMVPVQRKEPALAALLSFLLCGLGQVYAGDTVRGLVFFITNVILAIAGMVFVLTLVVPFMTYSLIFVVWVWNIFDAYNLAQARNFTT